MTIASALTALNTDIQNARTAITNKGGTVTVDGGSSQLATDIATITTLNGTTLSVTPSTFAQSFTPTSPYNAYTNVSVPAVTYSIDPNIIAENIKSGVTILGVTGTLDNKTKLGLPANIIYGATPTIATKEIDLSNLDVSGLTQVDSYGLYYEFYGANNLPQTINFSNLTTVGNYGMANVFYNCSYNLNTQSISILMPKLSSATNNSFYYMCRPSSTSTTTAIDYVEIGNSNTPWTLSSGNAFQYAFLCARLNNGVKIKGLTSVSGTNIFNNCFAGSSGNVVDICNNQKVFEFTDLTSASSTAFGYALAYRSFRGGFVFNPFPKLETVYTGATFNYFMYYSTTRPDSVGGMYNCSIITFPKLARVGVDASTNGSFNNAFTNTDYCYAYWFPSLHTIGRTTASHSYFTKAFSATTTPNNRYRLVAYPMLEKLLTSSSSATQGCWSGCNVITYFYLPKLNSVTGVACTTYMFNDCTQNFLEIHFGKENETYIKSLAGYSNKFGATNATIYFDLINHITYNGVVYDRDGNDYKLGTGKSTDFLNLPKTYPDDRYSWKNGNNIIYTTNAWTPAIGDNVLDENDNILGTITAVS